MFLFYTLLLCQTKMIWFISPFREKGSMTTVQMISGLEVKLWIAQLFNKYFCDLKSWNADGPRTVSETQHLDKYTSLHTVVFFPKANKFCLLRSWRALYVHVSQHVCLIFNCTHLQRLHSCLMIYRTFPLNHLADTLTQRYTPLISEQAANNRSLGLQSKRNQIKLCL